MKLCHLNQNVSTSKQTSSTLLESRNIKMQIVKLYDNLQSYVCMVFISINSASEFLYYLKPYFP